jgi:hypothetical protein
MDLYDLTPRMIQAELVWILNTSDGTDYANGVPGARISWPIDEDEIKKLAPHRSNLQIRDKLWPGGYLGMPAPKMWHYVNIYVRDEDNCRQYVGSVENGHDPV